MKITFDTENQDECKDILNQLLVKNELHELNRKTLRDTSDIFEGLNSIEKFLLDEVINETEWCYAHSELRKKAPVQFDRFWTARGVHEDYEVAKAMRSVLRWVLRENKYLYLPFNKIIPMRGDYKHKTNGNLRSKLHEIVSDVYSGS